ncbi:MULTISPECIES: (2Fe-2S) ferredoxin domain-containing protein [unclassified Coleofasciculus]|uniref:(2Fe-2S) ferredoxin domain-containing protein n=1 Tax=unclassified Coleofasciculus TaxID=2692782 RepID=UPI001882378C|nr:MULTISPECIES: (2Fe-2S) ferredoxin domain-containing protein [unclassified Coleofasciculus]MBE9125483.1 (2Fe-2S) ferredoxin domain-containing protein [Coleofasciculus sp. LEGE 07081]MBE9147454.1 (2Fe-2S) ferredoxin domain-containing protein [Coleofasciculus sp. LEGE 07092]
MRNTGQRVATDSQENGSKSEKGCVLICQHTSCKANGSADVLAAFEAAGDTDFEIKAAECQGQCSSGPTVRILPEETWYCRVKPNDVPVIVEQNLKGGIRVEEKLNPRIHMRFSF